MAFFGAPHPSPACRALCSPFSVAVEGLALRACTLRSPRRACAPFPLPGRGAAPHTFQSANRPSFFVPFAVLCVLCGKTDWQSAGGSRPLIGSNRRNRRFLLRVSLWFFVHLRVSPAGQTSHLRPTPSLSPACRAPRSPFSVLRSPFSGAQSAPPNQLTGFARQCRTKLVGGDGLEPPTA